MRDEMSERVAYYAALAAEGPHGHDATCPAYGAPSRQCMCGEDEREFLRRDVPALLAELEAARAVLPRLAEGARVIVDLDSNGLVNRDCECGDCVWCDDAKAIDAAREALREHDAAKAGKAVE